MLKKIATLLATVLCLGVLNSCTQNPNDAPFANGNHAAFTHDTVESHDHTQGFEQTQEVAPILAEDAQKLQQYEFMKSAEYIFLQNTAFDFFKAYIRADLETAQALIDDKNNECLSYFSSVERSLDSVEDYSIELVNYKLLDGGNCQIPSAHIDIRYRLHDKDSVVYMGITMNYVDKITKEGDLYKQWIVTFFDFEA